MPFFGNDKENKLKFPYKIGEFDKKQKMPLIELGKLINEKSLKMK